MLDSIEFMPIANLFFFVYFFWFFIVWVIGFRNIFCYVLQANVCIYLYAWVIVQKFSSITIMR